MNRLGSRDQPLSAAACQQSRCIGGRGARRRWPRRKRTNRPILLSVGYAACHWCHVMAHESFESPDVAAVMNELFVNIKVDREERPDVDAIYMQALQIMGEQGGWPLTMFCTPEGEPFWGGTYFPIPRGTAGQASSTCCKASPRPSATSRRTSRPTAPAS